MEDIAPREPRERRAAVKGPTAGASAALGMIKAVLGWRKAPSKGV